MRRLIVAGETPSSAAASLTERVSSIALLPFTLDHLLSILTLSCALRAVWHRVAWYTTRLKWWSNRSVGDGGRASMATGESVPNGSHGRHTYVSLHAV